MSTSKWELKETYSQDISYQEAYASKQGISFSPERRAVSILEGYAEDCISIYQELKRVAAAGHTEHLLDAEFERFHTKYLSLYHAYLVAGSRCVSFMIAGPSKFPTERQRKIGDREHARSVEVSEFKERAMTAIKRTLRPDLAPIRTEDGDAVERLTIKIEAAEKSQILMKKIGAFMRKEKAVEKRIVFLKDSGINANFLKEFYITGDGVPSFALTNNNANIRRMKQRLVEIQSKQAAPEVKTAGKDGIRLEESPADNRVRLFYQGKPAQEVIKELKSNGFRWTPSLVCWQAYYNRESIVRAKRFAGLDVPAEQV